MMVEEIIVGKNLYDFRKLLDMSQEDVAAETGVAQVTISEIENGSDPRTTTAMRLSRWADVEATINGLGREDWLDWSYLIESQES